MGYPGREVGISGDFMGEIEAGEPGQAGSAGAARDLPQDERADQEGVEASESSLDPEAEMDESNTEAAFAAIRSLKNEAEIRAFYDGYVESMKPYVQLFEARTGESFTAEEAAHENLSHALSHYDSTTRDRWTSVLPPELADYLSKKTRMADRKGPVKNGKDNQSSHSSPDRKGGSEEELSNMFHTNKDAAVQAVATLTTSGEIQAFYATFVESMRPYADLVAENSGEPWSAEQAAAGFLAFALQRHDMETRDRWTSVLPEDVGAALKRMPPNMQGNRKGPV
ncbi:MAG: hypothetical protein WC817_01960 [Patescibacteria group bacterium]|jgi:hypothetical protein